MDANSPSQNLFQIHPHHSEHVPLVYFRELMNLLSHKDKSTHEHSQRVYEITQEWIEHMQSRGDFSAVDAQSIQVAALIHDVGKVGVLDSILHKPAALNAHEREHMEQHSEIGYEMMRDFPGIEKISLAVRHHHERWDGKGYPLGLSGTRIPFGARVIAIVDAYDAMTSERPYKAARASKEALDEIAKDAGRHFCPELASKFVQFMHARNT